MILNPIKPLLRVLTATTAATALFLSTAALASTPEGTWLTSCQDGLSKTQIISQNNHSHTIEKFHQDRFCRQPSFVFITSGGLNFPAEINQIDFTYTQIQLVVHRKEVVQDFNKRSVCGLTNWKVSEPQTITGLKCALFNIHKPTSIPQSGDTKFGIYKIENDKLYFGKLSKENDGSTPEKRPQEYDNFFYSRSL